MVDEPMAKTMEDPILPESSPFSELSPLSPKQMQAISMILAGKSLTEIASELGCTRKTLAKWKASNPHFIATLNERKNEMFEVVNQRLQSLVEKAIVVLESSLDEGNYSAAVNVLKMVDLRPNELETDVEILVKQQSEQIALTQLYGVLPFAVKPWNGVDPQTQRLASDICNTLRTHYGIGTDALDELQKMSEQETNKNFGGKKI